MASSSRPGKKKQRVQLFWDPPEFQGVSIDYSAIYQQYKDRPIVSARTVAANFNACGFQEHADHLGLTLYLGIDEEIYPELMKLFYTNIRVVDENNFITLVRGVQMQITREVIQEALDLPAGGLRLLHQRLENVFPNPDYDLIYVPGLPKDNLHKHMRGCAKMFQRFAVANLITKLGNFDRMDENVVTLAYAFITETPFDISDIIFQRMSRVHELKHLPYGMYITRILKTFGVDLTDEKEGEKSNPLNIRTVTTMNIDPNAPIEYIPPRRAPPPPAAPVPPIVPPNLEQEIQQMHGEIAGLHGNMERIEKKQDKITRFLKRILRKLDCSTSSSSSD